MSGKRPRTAWLTGLFALTTAAGLVTAAPAGALSGADAKDSDLGYAVKVNFGDKQACSGVLVEKQWVMTAASCFADGGQPAKTGKPAVKTTVTVGRPDLGPTDGSTVDATYVNVHPDRDVALLPLAWPVVDAKPMKLSKSAPVAGEQLQSVGFGRTKTEWVPNKPHSGTFTVASVDGGSIGLNGSDAAVLCQGDAGAPAVRNVNGTLELVAVNSRSWQGGCLGTDPAETRTSALDTRVDGLGTFNQPIGNTADFRPQLAKLLPDVTTVMTAGDFNNDGRSDLAVVLKDGTLHTFAARADGTFEYGRKLWNDGSWKNATKIVAGDFNGDGQMDIASVWADGRLRLYAGKPDGKLAEGKLLWTDTKTDWNGMLQIARFKPDTSGRDGLLTVWSTGDLYAYPTDGDGVLGSSQSMWKDPSWKVASKLTTGDFNGDGRDDVVITDGAGALVRYGNGKGGLSDGVSMWPDKSWKSVQAILGGDFDGDGKTDLGSLWNNQQKFTVYKGKGDGTLASGTDAWTR
ncbi:FG-GAP-like repeat-containing protein [Streptomyces sp. NPDC050485]|uniref:FG-GAP-like repeat-containing protein n=1 Tax=Streptomyces sp. NPDC050485 TaxID=3365617 RepID=UPI0037A91327